jgi:hypothetical protein
MKANQTSAESNGFGFCLCPHENHNEKAPFFETILGFPKRISNHNMFIDTVQSLRKPGFDVIDSEVPCHA